MICNHYIYIASDSSIQVIILLISSHKHMLWLLIRSTLVVLMSTCNTRFVGKKRKKNNYFLHKNMLWLLIRSALGASNEYPQHVFVEK